MSERFPSGGTGETGAEDSRDVLRNRAEAATRSFSEEEYAAAMASYDEAKAELEALKAQRDGVSREKTDGEKTNVEKTKEKAKLNPVLVGLVGTVAVAAVASFLYFGFKGDKNSGPQENQNPIAADSNQEDAAEKSNPLIGELENGTAYDYSHYADRELSFDADGNAVYKTNKEAWNAYDYDCSGDYGDEEATIKGITSVAARTPEALASYAYSLFTDAEKEELGIAGMSMVEIDDYMSNEEDGGEMQDRLLEKLDQVLNDKQTTFKFYHEDDTEDTNYIYWIDDNGDGEMNPTELHIGYDVRDRNGAPQVDIYRAFLDHSDKDGDYYVSKKMIDLNMQCGYQPNYEKDKIPDGVPHIPADEDVNVDPVSTGNESAGDESAGDESAGDESAGNESAGDESTGDEGTGNENTDWGKEGDPHGGPNVDVSDPVNPDSEVTQQQSEQVNQGNQGYVDDGGATPGQGSDANNPNNNPDRLSGGENQGGSNMNGENVYQNPVEIQQGQQVDAGGNAAQEAAVSSGTTAGADNNSNAAEVQAVESGDF